jgi:hypothetical protein
MPYKLYLSTKIVMYLIFDNDVELLLSLINSVALVRHWTVVFTLAAVSTKETSWIEIGIFWLQEYFKELQRKH